jgi:tRNA-splicing ligase RtcB
MIHAGSVGLGHAVGGHFIDEARKIFPKMVKSPRGGFHPLPLDGRNADLTDFYLDSMANAANFAFANRLFLGLMAIRAIEEATGHRIFSKLIYDAPHNLIFRDGDACIHRKGATPAEGITGNGYIGKPVIIPGSMGAASYLLAGCGNSGLLESACHGAGRSLSRGKAAHVESKKFDNAVEMLRVVTPIDPESPRIKSRRDIMVKYRKRVMEEMPYAYKDIEPVIDSVEQADIAKKVVRLMPLCTVKG